MAAHLSDESRVGGNRRNGKMSKTVQTQYDEVTVETPRDRDGSFDPQNVKEHSDYYLQTFLYSHIVRSQQTEELPVPVSPALLFIQHAGAEDYDPTLCLGKDPVRDIATVSDRFMELFKQTVSEIYHQNIAFTPTDDPDRCRTCPYATLCGR